MFMCQFIKKTLLAGLLIIVSALNLFATPLADTAIAIPLGGNAWTSPNAKTIIDNKGLTNWTEANDVVSIYLRPETAGDLNIALKLRVPDGSSKISITVLNKTFTQSVSNTEFAEVNFGNITVKEPGYIQFKIRGLTKTGRVFADITDLVINGSALKNGAENLKVHLLKKGEKVHGGEFGGEGSGGQSYMNYPWVAGKTYCFLIRAQGDIAAETTIYTAYFKPLDESAWQLVASFKRPQSGSYLKGLHSFLENFDPKNGDQSRKVLFGNQWIVDIDGKWFPINEALFTGDETAKINFRKDYAGGIENTQFYLRNGGFFNDFTPLRSPLTKTPLSRPHPVIDFTKLP